MKLFGKGAAALLMLTLIAIGGSIGTAQGGAETQIHLRLREVERLIDIQPGGNNSLASACAPRDSVLREAVTGGGLTHFPGEISRGDVVVVTQGPFFSGDSGWIVEFRNETDAPVNIFVGVSAICAPGKMSSE